MPKRDLIEKYFQRTGEVIEAVTDAYLKVTLFELLLLALRVVGCSIYFVIRILFSLP